MSDRRDGFAEIRSIHRPRRCRLSVLRYPRMSQTLCTRMWSNCWKCVKRVGSLTQQSCAIAESRKIFSLLTIPPQFTSVTLEHPLRPSWPSSATTPAATAHRSLLSVALISTATILIWPDGKSVASHGEIRLPRLPGRFSVLLPSPRIRTKRQA